MFDSVQIVDTSEAEHKVLAVFHEGIPVSAIASDQLPQWFQTNLPQITQKIKDVETGVV